MDPDSPPFPGLGPHPGAPTLDGSCVSKDRARAKEGLGLIGNGLGWPGRLLSLKLNWVTPIYLTYGGAHEIVKTPAVY